MSQQVQRIYNWLPLRTLYIDLKRILVNLRGPNRFRTIWLIAWRLAGSKFLGDMRQVLGVMNVALGV